jgi:hypothetical protein
MIPYLPYPLRDVKNKIMEDVEEIAQKVSAHDLSQGRDYNNTRFRIKAKGHYEELFDIMSFNAKIEFKGFNFLAFHLNPRPLDS